MNPLTISDYKTVEQALCNANLKQALYDEGGVLMDRVLVTLHGDEHHQRRALEMRVFQRNYFRFFEEEILPDVLNRSISWRLAEGRADAIEFASDVMSNLTIAFAGLDREGDSAEETRRLIRLIRGLGLAATLGQSKLDREQVREQVRQTIEEFDHRLFQPSAARRQALIDKFNKGEIAEQDLPRDILTVLLRNEDKIELTRDMLLREVAFFYLAGAHTSVHSSGHVVHHLLDWIEAYPEDEEKLINDPLLLQRFVHESFRLHPSSPISMRKALADIEFENGQSVREGGIVVLNLQEANRNKDIFGEDAAVFNPYRDYPPRLVPFGVTFGIGIHSCLGRNLAAGTVLMPGKQPDLENHQIGTVASIARALLQHGARRDPDTPPKRDLTIERETWESYPVIFTRAGG